MANLDAELICSICSDIFRNPVTLRCGHNFCWECINPHMSRVYRCPQCRKRFSTRPVLSKNTNLSNIAEQFHCTQPANGDTGVSCNYCDRSYPAFKTCLQCETSMCERHLRSHNRSVQHTLIDPTSLENKKCPIHQKILGYYCAVDDACLCLYCSLAPEHREHQVEPLSEAFEKKREKLRELLKTMNSKTEEAERKVQSLQEEVRKIQEKAGVVTRRLHDRFREIRRQLFILEETLIEEVLVMKENSSRSHIDLIQELEKQKEELLMSKRCIEELCHSSNLFSVLQEKQSGAVGLHGIVEGESRKPLPNAGGLDVHPISKTLEMGLCDIMLGLNIWFYEQKPADLLLDVTTAANDLWVSDDLKTVNHPESNQNLPENPERFQSNQVINTRKFSSGRLYWEVETSDSGNWGVGVCYPSMDRRGDQSSLGGNSKSWCLRRCDNGLVVDHNGHSLSLPCRTSCNSLRVYLDYSSGRLSFYELSDPIRHLYTISATFTEPLHAAFMVQNSWLRIRNREIKLNKS